MLGLGCKYLLTSVYDQGRKPQEAIKKCFISNLYIYTKACHQSLSENQASTKRHLHEENHKRTISVKIFVVGL